MEAAPTGGEEGKAGPWRATLQFATGSVAAKVLGTRALYALGDDGAKKRVYVETAGEK